MSLFPSTIISNGRSFSDPLHLRVRTFRDPGVVEFAGTPRKTSVTELVLHETVTRDVKTTVRVLQKRRLGVHFIVGPDGWITQHADPARVRLEHAAPHNTRSVGIEIVNPFEPRYLKPHLSWDSTIRAPWAVGGNYVLPLLSQVEAATQLIAWLTSAEDHGLSISRTWRSLRDGRFVMGRVPGARTQRPGLYAHSSFRHSDGSWPLLYAFYRLELGLPFDQAYDLAVVRGQEAAPRVRTLTEREGAVTGMPSRA